jgi:hypothetical protein
MPQDVSVGTPPVTYHFRFPPPVAGGAAKTGWEALDKWVGGDSGGGAAAAPAAPSGKTGWEALDKWVPSGAGAGAAASAPAADAAPAAAAASSGGGFWASLKRLFGS